MIQERMLELLAELRVLRFETREDGELSGLEKSLRPLVEQTSV